MRREGTDPFVSAVFYRAAVQAVMIFVSETWVLLAEMAKRIEGFHVGLLCQVTGKTARQQWDRTWKRKGAASVIREKGIHNFGEYINRRYTTVAEWISLRSIYKVCEKEIGTGGGERLCETWWRQTAPRAQMGDTIGKIRRRIGCGNRNKAVVVREGVWRRRFIYRGVRGDKGS